MTRPPISIRCQNSDLHVVPAIHFRSIFAAEVNRICADPKTKPEAVAVELGPATAAAAFKWIKELALQPDGQPKLPVMLALVKQNRMFGVSLEEKVMRLLSEIGRDPGEYSPARLNRKPGLGYHQVLFLSPVDSIIEAVRCAFELDIPLYGVDLEDTADSVHKNADIQDPLSYEGTLGEYIAANLRFAGSTREPEIDLKREAAMAARLKAIMQRHKKTFFTCGMAHWLKIEEMLKDKSLRPGPLAEMDKHEPDEFRRVLVHPSIAAQYMDLFPSIAQAYERGRERLACKPGVSGISVNADAGFRINLRRSYKDYFTRLSRTALPENQFLDLESLSIFEKYLRGIQQLNNQAVPDLFTILQAAKETMSGDFLESVTGTFMKYPWARPEDHPEYALLMPPEHEARRSDCATLVDEDSFRREQIYISTLPSCGNRPASQQISYEWDKRREPQLKSLSFTWRPWEYLISAMSFHAIQACEQMHPKRKPVAFEGSLFEGIDMKSTLRSYSQGRDCVYVRDSVFRKTPKRFGLTNSFPVVWIFDPGVRHRAEWKILHEPLCLMERYTRDPATLRKIRKTRGDRMIASIGYGYSQSVLSPTASRPGFSVDHYYGIALFQPICWTNKQYAHWADLTRHRRNPFYSETSRDPFSGGDLEDFCEHRHRARLDRQEWVTTLILTALPFCTDRLTAVIPDECRIHRVAYEKAEENHVKIVAMPLNLFSAEEVSRAAKCQMVPAIALEPETRYSKSLEAAIGEPQRKNRELVPPEWLSFDRATWPASA